jgi:hypothetical protein
MENFLANTPLGTAVKTFVAVVLAAAVADFSTDGTISLGNWQTWVIAGLVSALPVIVNWLNPADSRYGNGAE